MKKDISRRSFLRLLGGGAVGAAAVMAGCKSKTESEAVEEYKKQVEPPVGKMTYRTNPFNQDKVSLLGYGMMRLPSKTENQDDYDQDMINRQIDYAIEHGVNYFDTSPVQMYKNSMKELQVDYIDYYLLHAVGGGMNEFNSRYVDNGMMDFLLKEREAGRIRNLGFSFHGHQSVFDEILAMHDKYHWDFVQIELNYLDWDYANEISNNNVDAHYLYDELQKMGIPAVIMEPLLGGRLNNLPQYLAKELKQRDPERSVASWAFRYAGTPEGVLTVLSGMTYMEHLKDNLLSYCPLVPLTQAEQQFLDEQVAQRIVGLENIPCNDCKYCMPCPYGIDIPAIFVHYNKCKNDGTLPRLQMDDEYYKLRRNYLIGLDRAVPRMRQADHCIGCGQCEPHCPQSIKIPRELQKISQFVEDLKQNKFADEKEQGEKA